MTMSKRPFIIFMLVAFLIGLLIGGLGRDAYNKFLIRRTMNVTLEADAGTTVVVLQRIREGNATNAIECLESQLDSDLLSMALLGTTIKDLERDSQLADTIALVRAYRLEFPHKSNHPDIDEKVWKALHF